MNFHLEPKNYASFVNATGTAYIEQAAEPYINKSIADNPSLRYDPASSPRSSSSSIWDPQGPPIAASSGRSSWPPERAAPWRSTSV